MELLPLGELENGERGADTVHRIQAEEEAILCI